MHSTIHLRPLARLDHPDVAPRFDAYLRELGAMVDGPTWTGATYPWTDAWATEPGRVAWAIMHEGREVGFALVRTPGSTGEPRHELAEFSIDPDHRGTGVAHAAIAALFARHPGTWRLSVLTANRRADRFWRRVCDRHAASTVTSWTEPDQRWRAFTIDDAQTRARADQLGRLVEASPGLQAALDAVRALDLHGAAIGAGTVRAVVWDARFAGASVAPPGDALSVGDPGTAGITRRDRARTSGPSTAAPGSARCDRSAPSA